MFRASTSKSFLITALLAVSLVACGGPDDPERVGIGIRYDDVSESLRLTLSREIASSETLHAQLRRGGIGELNCASTYESIDAIQDNTLSGDEPTFQGPAVPAEAFEPLYNSIEWLSGEPTPEMIEEVMRGAWIVDVCLMDGTGVVRQVEVDISRTTDVAGNNGKFDGDDEEQITSVGAYAQVCVAEMGEIPFFENIGENDYATANCLNGTPIPMQITDADGNVEFPEGRDESRGSSRGGWFTYDECDHQQYIYSSCEPNAVTGVSNGPRVQSASNEQGTHWVLLCRKSQEEEGVYADIAMIGSNPYTGKTCFFQNGLNNLMDGQNIPHPGDLESTTASPNTWEHIWSGLQGGEGGAGGINCVECHDSDAFIHTEWIDGALDDQGRTVIPRMGVHEDFALGFNDAPYDLVARDRVCNGTRCGWTMQQHLVSEEAAACTSCHRIGAGRFADSWLERLEPNDSGEGTNNNAWNNRLTAHGQTFGEYAWMPPEVEGLDAESWADSDVGRAINFIQMCADNPSDPACIWEDVPSEPNSELGELPTIDLEGMELATEAAKILGGNVTDAADPRCDGEDGDCATRRCTECHSVSNNGLNHWLELTEEADSACDLSRLDALHFEPDPDIGTFDGVAFTQAEAQRVLALINDGTEEQLDDAGLRSNSIEVIIAERPFASMEILAAVEGIGPATMEDIYEVATDGLVRSSAVTSEEALAMVTCMRSVPEDPTSVFEAAKMGIYVAGAQYGMFQDLFRRAYGNEAYLVEFLKFKQRVTMPKGNHPRLSQREFATVLKWFDNDLVNIDDVIIEPPRPQTCEPNLGSPEMLTHIEDMRFDGWEAVNRENGIRMFGCEGDEEGADCLKNFDSRDDQWGAGLGNIHELTELDFRTSYWTRTSADGRFVGNGGGTVSGFGSTVTDLLRNAHIGIDGAYDPGFFPDNSGFVWQGGGSGTGICSQSILETATTIDFTEPECIRASGINLYQHVARGLNGGDYYVINSQFTSDSGGDAGQNPRASWDGTATMKFTPMVFNGTTFEPQPEVIVESPYEGDSVLSPSGRAVISRLSGPDGGGIGYVIRRVETNGFGNINIGTELATVCGEGTKGNISFDERFFVTHVYNGTNSDIFIYDLMDGSEHQVTNMPDNLRALFPHFRSDGWFYFLVRDDDGGERWMAASDAALTLRGE